MVLLKYLKPEVIEKVRDLILEDEKLEAYMKIYKDELNRSLDEETAEDAAIESFVTYLSKLPNGTETGDFLALEFGSPTLKIMLLTLNEGKYTCKMEEHKIPEKYMVGESDKLFYFIAKCLVGFLRNVKLKMLRIPLGITFGFPIEQVNLQECRLLRWVKGFNCKDLVGKSIFTKLRESFLKFPDLKRVYIIGILNETTSMLLSAAINSRNCKIAMVIGYAVSCCYMEKVSRIGKYHSKSYGEKFMCISLETSAFGENGCLDDFRTSIDKQVDKESRSPGKLTTDKMTSITYMGEIARLAIIRCIEANLILGGVVTKELNQKRALHYDHMLQIESDPEKEHENCRKVLAHFGYNDVSDEDCTQIQFICRCVSRRTANLMAAQLATLINRINEPHVTVALDGAMVRDYPQFERYLVRKLQQLKNPDLTFEVLNLEDNSLIKGAGVLASVFGKEVMDVHEKLRRLPGFPADKCHFRQTGSCRNPNCNARLPCDNSGVNPLNKPMLPQLIDIEPDCFDHKACKEKKEKSS